MRYSLLSLFFLFIFAFFFNADVSAERASVGTPTPKPEATDSSDSNSVEKAVGKAKDFFVRSASAVNNEIKNTFDGKYHDDVKKIFVKIDADPKSFDLHIEFIDRTVREIERQIEGLEAVLNSDLVKRHDALVNGLNILIAEQKREAERLRGIAANEDSERHKKLYSQLAEAAEKLSSAYALSAQRYRDLDLKGLLVSCDKDKKYLEEAKKLLSKTRSALKEVLNDQQALELLYEFRSDVETIHNGILSFTDTVLEKAINIDLPTND